MLFCQAGSCFVPVHRRAIHGIMFLINSAARCKTLSLLRGTPGGEAGGDGDAGGGERRVRVLSGAQGQHGSAAGVRRILADASRAF